MKYWNWRKEDIKNYSDLMRDTRIYETKFYIRPYQENREWRGELVKEDCFWLCSKSNREEANECVNRLMDIKRNDNKEIKFEKTNWEIWSILNSFIFTATLSSPCNEIQIKVGGTINGYRFLGLI